MLHSILFFSLFFSFFLFLHIFRVTEPKNQCPGSNEFIVGLEEMRGLDLEAELNHKLARATLHTNLSVRVSATVQI